MSWLWGSTATRHCDRESVMWLMTSQQLVVVLNMWMAVVFSQCKSSPPTASSRPSSEVHVDKITGVSATLYHTLGPLSNDEVFSCPPKDCGWQNWRRAAVGGCQASDLYQCSPISRGTKRRCRCITSSLYGSSPLNASDEDLCRATGDRCATGDCGCKDWRRSGSEQVNTDFDVLFSWS